MQKRHYQNSDERIFNGRDESFLVSLLRTLYKIGVSMGGRDEFTLIPAVETRVPAYQHKPGEYQGEDD